MLRYARSCGENTAYFLERQLSAYEAEAATFGPAADGAEDAVRSLYASGHSVTAVGNQSVQAIRSFLAVHDLLGAVRRVSARVGPHSRRLLPDPFLLNQVIEVLGSVPERYLFIAATAGDAEAAQAIGIPVIGYGVAIPGGASIESMSELVVDELINWRVH
ncbi:MAG TPA: hypothetical protein VGN81_30380 [Pseudonocardiaceae bacterium]